MAIVSTSSHVPPEWLGQRPRAVYEKYTAPDGSRRRRKKFDEWEQLLGNRETSETDPDEFNDAGAEYDYISTSDVDEEAEIYTVVYKRVAIRQTPFFEGKVLGTVDKGAQLQTFGCDDTERWRKIHFKLPGTSSKRVAAWVLVRHDQLGPLLRASHLKEGDGGAARHGLQGYAQIQHQTQNSQQQSISQPNIVLKAPYCNSPVFLLSKDELRLAAVEAPSSPSKGKQERDGWTDFMAGAGKFTKEDDETESDEDGSVAEFEFLSRQEAEDMAEKGSVLYEVVLKPMAPVRAKPTKDGSVIGKVDYGLRVDTYEWDESHMWRKVCCVVRPGGKLLVGWLMETHPEGFAVLEEVPN